jgi:hypothetical protein
LSVTAFAGYTISPTILAGQNINVGSVKITGNADGSLTFDFMLKGGQGYCITDAAIHVGLLLDDFPQNPGGAIPGQFDYKYDFGGCVSAATVTISDPPGDKGDIYIAVHVNVYGPDGQQETGWVVRCGDLEGAQFPGRNWSAWISFPADAWY